MRAQGVQDLPDNTVAFIVIERLFRRHPGGHPDGQNHIAHLLAFSPAHDAANGLHHVDLALA
ncbi:MAG: hypothetical protein KGZ72_05790, partial [Roseovarius sp.]|nr:hypothetical protein [Roseovarius sp.]